MCIGYAFQLRNDTAEFKIIRRPSGPSAGHGWAAVYSRGDSRFLAGLDVPGRIFCIVSRDHRLPDEKGSKAPRATNEGSGASADNSPYVGRRRLSGRSRQ